jgi:hypothetical protein
MAEIAIAITARFNATAAGAPRKRNGWWGIGGVGACACPN